MWLQISISQKYLLMMYIKVLRHGLTMDINWVYFLPLEAKTACQLSHLATEIRRGGSKYDSKAHNRIKTGIDANCKWFDWESKVQLLQMFFCGLWHRKMLQSITPTLCSSKAKYLLNADDMAKAQVIRCIQLNVFLLFLHKVQTCISAHHDLKIVIDDTST